MRLVSLVKPGIIFGNIITFLAGYGLAASKQAFDIGRFAVVLTAMAAVIASGCVFNNIIDRDIDRLMSRTKQRVLAVGALPLFVAWVYGVLLGLLGFTLFYFFSDPFALIFAAVGWFFYVILYSCRFKRRSVYGTAIGGIAGAAPPVIGYCAVAGKPDLATGLLFLMLFLWQIPHSYAIGIYRLGDYRNADIPVLPVKSGIAPTKNVMLIFVLSFVAVTLSFGVLGYAGPFYIWIAAIPGAVWIMLTLAGYVIKEERLWARRMFLMSILNLTCVCVALSIRQ